MAKPDLGAMAISKAKAGATVPFQDPASSQASGSPKSLTIKLDGPTYAALRLYCHEREMERGKRVTHQEVAVAAIQALLGIKSGQG